jgi:hypothetical protein
MPELSLPPPKLVALVVCGRWAFAGQDIADVSVNEIAYRVAATLSQWEVPAFKHSTLMDFCPFLSFSEGLKAG